MKVGIISAGISSIALAFVAGFYFPNATSDEPAIVTVTPPSNPESMVKSSLSAALPDFTQFTHVQDKKDSFFRFLLPRVQRANRKILEERKWLQALDQKSITEISQQDIGRLLKLASKYKASVKEPSKIIDELLVKVDIIPPSLALAQAANESAWGTSRFAVKANNLFGQWCYVEGCGVIPKQRSDDEKHEVAKFNTVQASIDSYMRNLNSQFSYETLRQIRNELRDQGEALTGSDLAEGLLPYSTRREEYVKEIRSMINYNKLEDHDG